MAKATRFKAVLFDFDGTLVETHGLILASYNHALTANGKPAVDMSFLSKWAGVPLRDVFTKMGYTAQENDAILASYKEFQKGNLHLTRAFPGTKETLEELKQKKIKVGIVTARYAASTKLMLEHTGLGHFIKEIIAPDNFSKNKPSPEPFLECARLIGVNAKDCLVVGDGCADIVGGHDAGMKTALAEYGYGAAHGCHQKPDFKLKKVADVLNLV
ncbi:HAD family hydrolase [Candidatus Micrarchaeota archaeon]|nr:HAD family hydrolase [Candidatus Micrarchaeota archaeon]MBI5176488.1 HAD family hydrolase [Candidatus Micrarchaeota archaeon]